MKKLFCTLAIVALGSGIFVPTSNTAQAQIKTDISDADTEGKIWWDFTILGNNYYGCRISGGNCLGTVSI